MTTALVDRVDRLLRLGEPGRHPGGAIIGVLTEGGSEVRAAGWAALPDASGHGVPMSPELQLDLASVTKVASTTAMIMRLVALDAIRLEDPVIRFLPDFAAADPSDGTANGGTAAAARARVTIEQLLTHTAGLRPWWPFYCETRDRESAILRAQRLPLATSPGTEHRYSDLGLILAGAVVERATSLPLQQAYRELVAEPLGLGSGYGPIPAEVAATGADSDAYEFEMIRTGDPYPVPFGVEDFAGWREGPVRGEANDGNTAHALGGVSGHAGLFSTVDDLLALGSALQGGEFVSREVLHRFSVASPLEAAQAVGFRRSSLDLGAGTGADAQPLTLLSHMGFTGTWFGFALEQRLVVAGAALRLHGTVGPLPRSGDERPGLPSIASSSDIDEVMLAAAIDAASPASTTDEVERP